VQTTRTDLRTIRQALEASSRLTSLSGSALALAGVLAFLAAGYTGELGARDPQARLSLSLPQLMELVALWGGTLLLVVSLNLTGMLLRARSDGQPLASRLMKRVLFAMAPALFVGGCLTLALLIHNKLDLVLTVWMLCYGAALVSASAHSISSVRLLGLWTLLGGALSLLPPLSGQDFALFLATFGAGHLVLGLWVGVRYGW
jgi:hypothetical protein